MYSGTSSRRLPVTRLLTCTEPLWPETSKRRPTLPTFSAADGTAIEDDLGAMTVGALTSTVANQTGVVVTPFNNLLSETKNPRPSPRLHSSRQRPQARDQY